MTIVRECLTATDPASASPRIETLRLSVEKRQRRKLPMRQCALQIGGRLTTAPPGWRVVGARPRNRANVLCNLECAEPCIRAYRRRDEENRRRENRRGERSPRVRQWFAMFRALVMRRRKNGARYCTRERQSPEIDRDFLPVAPCRPAAKSASAHRRLGVSQHRDRGDSLGVYSFQVLLRDDRLTQRGLRLTARCRSQERRHIRWRISRSGGVRFRYFYHESGIN